MGKKTHKKSGSARAGADTAAVDETNSSVAMMAVDDEVDSSLVSAKETAAVATTTTTTATSTENEDADEEEDKPDDDDENPEGNKDIDTDPAVAFADMGLDPRLLRAVAKMGFAGPTLVQAKAIPLALAGKDILARARTGSGKTAAYCIPVIQKILAAKTDAAASTTVGRDVRALVLVPTRELAEQVHGHIRQLAMYAAKDVRVVNIATNDASVSSQRAVLAELPDIVVATPAKAIVHIDATNLVLRDSLESLVIDEADLIMSYGYNEDLRRLLSHLPHIFQSYLMSATFSADVEELKQLVLRNPAILKLEETQQERDLLTQYYIECTEQDKFLFIFFILKLRVSPFGSGKAIIFVNSIDRCYRLKLFLEQFGIRSCALNSELPLKSRYHIVQEFNKGVYDYIIATDESGDLKGREADSDDEGGNGDEVAGASAKDTKHGRGKKKGNMRRQRDGEYGVARGIDFVNVQAVINFDLPRTSRAYQHRVGRTARGVGNKGYALSFVFKQDDKTGSAATQNPKKRAGSGSASKADLVSETQAAARIRRKTDDHILARIQRRQTAHGRELMQFAFDMAQVEGFRYRCADAIRAVTATSIRDARLKEIKAEILNSEKLKSHFEENPKDLEALRHDRPVHPTRVQSHMRHVPTYLLPRGKISVSAGETAGSVSFRGSGSGRRRSGGVGKKRTGATRSAAAKRRADPLKSFRVNASAST